MEGSGSVTRISDARRERGMGALARWSGDVCGVSGRRGLGPGSRSHPDWKGRARGYLGGRTMLKGGQTGGQFLVHQNSLAGVNPALLMSLGHRPREGEPGRNPEFSGLEVAKPGPGRLHQRPVEIQAPERRPQATQLEFGGGAEGLGISTFSNTYELW